MSTVIKNNMSAVRIVNLMTANHTQAQKNLEKIASGMKLNSAKDDASAFSISERMRVRIRALDQAYQNAQNATNMVRTAEGAVMNILETLRTLKEKALDSANDSNTDDDRRIIQKEFNQLIDQIDDDVLIQFNGMYLINNRRNNAMYGTQSVYFNPNLALDTNADTLFSEMRSRNGDTLGIKSTDKIYWSYVSNTQGTFHGEVDGDSTFENLRNDIHDTVGLEDINTIAFVNDGSSDFSWQDKSGRTVYPDPGVFMTSMFAPNNGFYAFSGFNFTVVDQEGNVNKFASANLNFVEIQRAESRTGDNSLSYQIGAEANQAVRLALTDLGSRSLGLKYWWSEDPTLGYQAPEFLSISNKDDANAAVDVVERAIQRVLDQETTLGAFLVRMEHTAINIDVAGENVQASESTIRDADMAKEMTNYTKNNLLIQSSQAMLAQANQNPMNVLALLNTV